MAFSSCGSNSVEKPQQPSDADRIEKMSTPSVSVVMSVFNGELFLREAVESVLGQDFGDFEFIIINDGSTDSSGIILDSYKATDDRVRVYHQENRGLVASLNRGCEVAQGKYIARMDADDISIKERLTWQFEFLEKHPDISVVGGAVALINSKGEPIGKYRAPITGPGLKAALLDHCALIHPTVLMRNEAFAAVRGYRKALVDAEDWDLWLRMADHFELTNLKQVVLKYRLHPHQITARKCRQQAVSGLVARAAAVCRRRGQPDPLDFVAEVTPITLAALGIKDEVQKAAVTREYLRCIKNMYEAGEYSMSRAAAIDMFKTSDWQFAEGWVLAEVRMLMAHLDWHERRFLTSILAVIRTVMMRPKMIGRPFKPFLAWLGWIHTSA